MYISSVTDITQFPVKDHAVIRSKFQGELSPLCASFLFVTHLVGKEKSKYCRRQFSLLLCLKLRGMCP